MRNDKRLKTSADWSKAILVRVGFDLTGEDLGRLAFASLDGETAVFDVLKEIYDEDMTPWEQFCEAALAVFEDPARHAALRIAFARANCEAA